MTYAIHFLYFGKGRYDAKWHSRASQGYLISVAGGFFSHGDRRAFSVASKELTVSYIDKNARLV